MAEIDAVGGVDETEETSSWWGWLLGSSKTEREQKTQSAATSALESLPAEKVPESAPPLTDRVTPQEPTSPTLEESKTEQPSKTLKPCSLELCSPESRDNPNIVYAAVIELDISELRYASARLLSDTNFARKLLSQDGTCLQYLSPKIQDDPELVRLAIEETPFALQFASPLVQETLLEVARQTQFELLQEVLSEIATISDLLKRGSFSSPEELWQSLSESFGLPPQIISLPLLHQYLPVHITDREFLRPYIEQDGLLLLLGSEELLHDPDLLQLACLDFSRKALQAQNFYEIQCQKLLQTSSTEEFCEFCKNWQNEADEYIESFWENIARLAKEAIATAPNVE